MSFCYFIFPRKDNKSCTVFIYFLRYMWLQTVYFSYFQTVKILIIEILFSIAI